jgi:hypothetical protein
MKYLILLLLAFSLNAASSTRKSVLNNLNTIIIKEIELNDLVIEEVIKVLQSKSGDKINFLYLLHSKVKPPPITQTNNIPFGVDPINGLPLLPPAPLPPLVVAPADNAPRIVSGNIVLKNVSIKQALDIAVLCFNQPMQYAVTDFGVVFMHRKDGKEALFTRRFIVNPNIFKK